jgi:pyridinium-3,5-bisthiocarboxylic acid mononucleotide nickel chelatase
MSNLVAYLDCPMGISGDMCLGALVSAGVPLTYLTEVVQQMNLGQEISLSSELVNRQGQEALKVEVHLNIEQNHHRHLPEIEQIIRQAKLAPQIELWSLATFRRLAIAESQVHGIPLEQVHFHEVGALDAIADIVCTCAGFNWLGITEIRCSPLPTGGGYVKCEHGQLPVPVPAVLKLWETYHVPVYANGIQKELVTPTGAALAVTLSQGFGVVPPMSLKKVGLGAGSSELAIPNILRLWIGEKLSEGMGEIQKIELGEISETDEIEVKKKVIHSH